MEQFNFEVYKYLIHDDNGLKVRLAGFPSTIISQNIQLKFAMDSNGYFDCLFRENYEEFTVDALNFPPGQVTEGAIGNIFLVFSLFS